MAQIASSHFSLVHVPRGAKTARLRQFGQPRRLHGLARRAAPDGAELPPSSPSPSNEQATESDLVVEKKEENNVNQESGFVEFPNRDINRRIALATSFGAISLFFSSRLEFGVSLKDLAANAVPYEQALSNGRPTVVEFYADWCEVCRELAPDIYNIEQQYKDKVNFVMLNVDNTKWEQELDEFGVEGIPHFAFLDKDGNEEGNVVGRLPRKLLQENVLALANGEDRVPHSRIVGKFSSSEGRKVRPVADPRSHG
ncbi:hypothetical protein LUZ60_010427 [Juncus effusus]|nr:hypothetical protein LUZ60_010427 [Juncus effusus]